MMSHLIIRFPHEISVDDRQRNSADQICKAKFIMMWLLSQSNNSYFMEIPKFDEISYGGNPYIWATSGRSGPSDMCHRSLSGLCHLSPSHSHATFLSETMFVSSYTNTPFIRQSSSNAGDSTHFDSNRRTCV